MIVMVFILIANCIVQCLSYGLYVQDNKMATEAILGQSFVCLLHVLQHWLHGLTTLVTNFSDVGPIFKI